MSETTQGRPLRSTAEAKEQASAAAAELLARTGAQDFDAVVVLGPGLAGAIDELGTPDSECALDVLPGFGPVPGPESATVYGVRVGERRAAFFTGPVHLFDGLGPVRVAHAVRTGIATGARTVLLVDAVGSLRADFAVGQPILVRDHINLMAASPLVGPDFVDLTHAYSPRLREAARAADGSLAEGVYGAVAGPQLGTPAEIGVLRTAGADLVGAATVLETIAAVETGAEVLGVCLVTHDAVGPSAEPRDAERLLAVARRHAPAMGALLNRILRRL